ncbi:MAG TPA: nitrate- and nitrite sensing domain-containing protein [Actinomycetota bacterium]
MFGNLSIRSKLLSLLAVPVAGSLLLGVAGVAGGFGERARAAEEARVAVVAGQAVAAAHELQEERVRAVAWLAAGAQPAQSQPAAGRRAAEGESAARRTAQAELNARRAAQAELAGRRRRVDRALAAYRAGAAGLGRTGDPALDQALAAATTRLERLLVVRAETDRRLLPPELAGGGYDALVDALLAVARGLAARLDAPGPSRTARLLLAVAAAKEATGQERTLLAAVPPTPRTPGVRDPNPPIAGPPDREGNPAANGAGSAVHTPAPAAAAADVEVPAARLVARAAVARGELNAMRAAAGERLAAVDRALGGAGVREVRRLELALFDPVAGPVGDLKPWEDGLAARAGALRQLERAVADDLARGAVAWRVGQERRLRSWLLLAGAVLVAALAAAAAALRVRDGGREPALAAAGTVLGLARRGQALADRQLQLLEGLTRDEPDPQRRRDLLGADNLAGRLRRTAETMLAVASPGPVRERARPLPIDAVLRAATAEAEPGGAPTPAPGAGRRVDLLTTGDVEVAGPAAVDLVHLLAELLDNAAAFSSPTAPIVVTGAADGHAYLVEVTDRGLGMTDQELAWANQRLASRGPGADPAAHAAGDRLGLVVVGRLARRNGFEVRLGRSPTGGVSATVRVPAAVLGPSPAVPVRRR